MPRGDSWHSNLSCPGATYHPLQIRSSRFTLSKRNCIASRNSMLQYSWSKRARHNRESEGGYTYQKKNHILHIVEKESRSSTNSTPLCGVASTSRSLQSDWTAFNSGTGTSSSQFRRLNSNVALTWLSNSWFIWLKSNELYAPPRVAVD